MSLISTVHVDGVCQQSQESINKAFRECYKQLYAKQNNRMNTGREDFLLDIPPPQLPKQDGNMLGELVYQQEVKDTILLLGRAAVTAALAALAAAPAALTAALKAAPLAALAAALTAAPMGCQ
ncbi:hypothetical protein NDU88_002899 [Pleurodeles waltl]|uniref:Uncharacterized protein n=1 Tax=Pleurodeles waltl TaxID=8319 RepID=A0AAV7QE09_PLEWA|nr:hypothetical protein NDU88_002899 [Pleurodeles waltl]